ncbi:hypothetical protein AVEN_114369-1, partial [Araneus ventricosus]
TEKIPGEAFSSSDDVVQTIRLSQAGKALRRRISSTPLYRNWSHGMTQKHLKRFLEKHFYQHSPSEDDVQTDDCHRLSRLSAGGSLRHRCTEIGLTPSLLGRSFTGRTAPTRNPHIRALRSPRATAPIPAPYPNGTLAVVFAFKREPYFVYPKVAFIMVEHSKWISSEVGFPTFEPQHFYS